MPLQEWDVCCVYRNVLKGAQTIEEEVNNNKHNSMWFPLEPAAPTKMPSSSIKLAFAAIAGNGKQSKGALLSTECN
jgi:hypothetical protein